MICAGPAPTGAGALPPNFSFAYGANVTRISSDFLRLRVKGAGLQRLARDMIYFRLLLPREHGRESQWPHLSKTRQTVWPDDLYQPACTVRAIDPLADWLETDIFIHDRGRTCAFAASAGPGTQVGLTGPKGGRVPTANHLVTGGRRACLSGTPRHHRGPSA